MVDFSSLLGGITAAKPITPLDIFEACVRSEKFAYLRGDQQKLLNDWYSRRDDKDTIIKMNTGAGKTIVGLLQLQSSLNEGIGPALYLCLNNQLVDQVLSDSHELGIKCVTFDPNDNTLPTHFLNGEAILVTNLQKLFNAKSVFGIQGTGRPPIEIGAIVIDDAHAAATIARDVFTLTFESNHRVYRTIVAMFSESLKAQALGTALDIMEGRDRYSVILIPYWSWLDRLPEVTTLLAEEANINKDSELKFKWPIVRDYLKHYYVFVSADRLEIMPKCLPIQKITSFHNAKRRIYMSATLNDDSVLVRDFQVSKDSILNPLSATTQTDIGEKMILAPYNLDRSLDRDTISDIFSNVSNYNIVVLVGSDKRAQYWTNKGYKKPNAANITQTLNELRNKKGNKVVLSNRYDGIDLPGDMCRILIIDDLPSVNTLYEQYSMYVRPSSKIWQISQAQKVEQGLGRAVRSVNDYCVVLLCGGDLISTTSTYEFQNFMSPQTVAQIRLGNEIVGLMKKEHDKPSKILAETMKKVLQRDNSWMLVHKQTLTKAIGQTINHGFLIDYANAERKSFDFACLGDSAQAGDSIIQAINTVGQLDDADKGWYLQLAASYYSLTDSSKAMDKQLAAHSLNTYLLRPPSGIRYQKLTNKETQQSTRIVEVIRRYTEWNGLIMYVNNILDKLVFMENSSKAFEKAMKDIGECLGFESQRPEHEYGVGCDVLWNMYDRYWIVEAKNEVKLSRQEIYKDEAAQLSNSMNWFNEEYPGNQGTPILVHPCSRTNREAYPPAGTMVILPDNLEILCSNIRNFYASLAGRAMGEWDSKSIAAQLRNHKLDKASLICYLKPVD